MAASPDFERLYREHYSRVLGLCRRLLNSVAQAEDATQEAFMRAYNKFDRYDSSQPFWQWIATIANNYCIDLLRRRNKEFSIFDSEEDEQSLDLPSESAVNNISSLMKEENKQLINQAIGNLNDKYRVPLVMSYYNEFSYDEIASILDVSRNHVGVLLLRAKQNLRKEVEKISAEAGLSVEEISS